jgi:hypothetical protein
MRRRLVLAGVAVGMAAASVVPAMASTSSVGATRSPAVSGPHSTRLMCPRLSQQQLNDAEQRACLVIFGP